VRVGSYHTLVPLLTMLRVFRTAEHPDEAAAAVRVGGGDAGSDGGGGGGGGEAAPSAVRATADATTSVNVNGCRAYLSTMAPYGGNVAVELHRCVPRAAAAGGAAAAAAAPTHLVRVRLHERYVAALPACGGAPACALPAVRAWLAPVLGADWDAQRAADRVPAGVPVDGGGWTSADIVLCHRRATPFNSSASTRTRSSS